MAKTYEELMEELPAARQAKIKARAVEMLATNRTLRELRKSLGLTQTDVADAMKVGQDKISQLERREDALVSTLRRAASAMGAELKLMLTFENGEKVVLEGFGDEPRKARGRAKPVGPARSNKPKALTAGRSIDY